MDDAVRTDRARMEALRFRRGEGGPGSDGQCGLLECEAGWTECSRHGAPKGFPGTGQTAACLFEERSEGLGEGRRVWEVERGVGVQRTGDYMYMYRPGARLASGTERGGQWYLARRNGLGRMFHARKGDRWET